MSKTFKESGLYFADPVAICFATAFLYFHNHHGMHHTLSQWLSCHLLRQVPLKVEFVIGISKCLALEWTCTVDVGKHSHL
jgi:hypothetical protein